MKLAEFEALVDKTGLKKLEVKMEHTQVKWFICESEWGEIFIFGKNGEAYRTRFEHDADTSFEIIRFNEIFPSVITNPIINGYPAGRDIYMDLKSQI